IAELVGQLGDRSFRKREEAARRLTALGATALPALRRAAATSADPEGRPRAATPVGAIAGWLFRELRQRPGPGRPLSTACAPPDGRRALAAGQDDPIRLWDLTTGAELRRFAGHPRGVVSVAVSADGRRAASGGQDKTVRVWDVESGRELCRLTGHVE